MFSFVGNYVGQEDFILDSHYVFLSPVGEKLECFKNWVGVEVEGLCLLFFYQIFISHQMIALQKL